MSGSAIPVIPLSLVGAWTLDRSVDNGASNTGIAVFTRQDERRLAYHEQGRFRLPTGQVIDAERRYIFEETDNGFAVLFAETPPRLFHRVSLERLGANVVGDGMHLCGDDHYDSRYEFRADGSFLIRHTVCGPRKNYVMESTYRRGAAS